jgi:WD40 repeat protein
VFRDAAGGPAMKIFEDALIVVLFVAGAVMGGLWCVNDIPLQDMPALFCKSLEPPLPTVSVNHIDWSADGSDIFSLARGEPDSIGSLMVHSPFSASTRRLLIDVSRPIGAAAFEKDGSHVALGTYRGELQWIELDSCSVTKLVDSKPFQSHQAFTAVAVADGGTLVAGGTLLGSIYLCDPEHQTVRVLGEQSQGSDAGLDLSPGATAAPEGGSSADAPSSVSGLWFSSDRSRLVSTQNNGCVKLWDTALGEVLRQFAGHRGPATAAALLPNREEMISTGLDDTVRIWDIVSGREVWCGQFGLGGVLCVAVSADGSTSAWAGYGRKIIVWDLQTRQKRFDLHTPASIVMDLKFSPDGTLLAAGGKEQRIRLYDMQTGAERTDITALVSSR